LGQDKQCPFQADLTVLLGGASCDEHHKLSSQRRLIEPSKPNQTGACTEPSNVASPRIAVIQMNFAVRDT
jgi:hypothetical protein